MTDGIEIDLRMAGEGTMFEYYAHCVPRVGERIVLSVDEYKGIYVVTDVLHHVFRERDKRILSYAEVTVTNP